MNNYERKNDFAERKKYKVIFSPGRQITETTLLKKFICILKTALQLIQMTICKKSSNYLIFTYCILIK